MKERNQSIDAVKGFAILLVMLGHCIVWNNMAPQDSYVYDFIKSVQMPLFMAVSGYLAGLGQKRRNLKEMGSLLLKRGQAYLIPFFIWPILLHPLHPLLETKGILFQLDKGLWFLMTLFVATVVSELAQWVSYQFCPAEKEKKLLQPILYLIVIFLFYVLFFLQGRSDFTLLGPSLTLSYLPFYVGGYVSTYLTQEKCVKPENAGQRRIFQAALWVLWALAGALFLGMIVLFDLQASGGIKELAVQMAAGAFGTFFCFWGIYHIKKGKAYGGLARIGNITLELYIFQYALHGVFVRSRGLGDTPYCLYTGSGVLIVLLTFLLMWFVSIPGIYIIRKIPLLDALLFGRLQRLGKTVQK